MSHLAQGGKVNWLWDCREMFLLANGAETRALIYPGHYMEAPKHPSGNITICFFVLQSFSAPPVIKRNRGGSTKLCMPLLFIVVALMVGHCCCPLKGQWAVEGADLQQGHISRLQQPWKWKRDFFKEYINRCQWICPEICRLALWFICPPSNTHTHGIWWDFRRVRWPLFYLYVPGWVQTWKGV